MPTEPEHSGRLAEVGGNPLTPRFEQDEPETALKLTPDPTFGNPLPMGMSTAEAGRERGWTGRWRPLRVARRPGGITTPPTCSDCCPCIQIVAHVRMLMLMHLASWRWGSASRHVSTDRQVDRQTLRQSGSMADDLGRLYTS
jgi:hypothetical protein